MLTKIGEDLIDRYIKQNYISKPIHLDPNDPEANQAINQYYKNNTTLPQYFKNRGYGIYKFPDGNFIDYNATRRV